MHEFCFPGKITCAILAAKLGLECKFVQLCNRFYSITSIENTNRYGIKATSILP